MKKLQKLQKGLLVPDLVATGTTDAKPKIDDTQTLHDSDSGLDTTSIGSQKNIKQPDAQTDATSGPHPTPEKSDSGITSDSSADALQKSQKQKTPKKQYDSRRRRIPKLGLSIKQNPDLSFIRRKPPPRCISCDNDLCQRQPLVKTNGILFMKRREKECLNLENRHNYESVWDCAFTRSDIVADWTDDLKDHQDFCDQEIRTSLRYQRKYYEKQRRELQKDPEFDENDENGENIDTGQKATDESPTTLRRENSKRISKIEEKLKKMKSKVQNTMQRAKNNQGPIINGFVQDEFLPPPTARPKVKTRPVQDENFEINFSGKLQSTVLRLHCENCVLRDKPEEFQSVLFVCQL